MCVFPYWKWLFTMASSSVEIPCVISSSTLDPSSGTFEYQYRVNPKLKAGGGGGGIF